MIHGVKADLIMICLSFSVMVNAQSLADDIEPGDNVNEIVLPLTAHSAAQLIVVEQGGKVLSTTEVFGPRQIFKIKVLHGDGRIKIYQIDAQTGHAPTVKTSDPD